MEARAGRDPFEGLAEDHRKFLSLLDQMGRTGPDRPVRRVALLLALKRGLAKHAMAEEDIVYPLLRKEAQAIEETRRLYAEHGEIKVLMFELEQRAETNSEWRNEVMQLRELIASHGREEEEVEFPRLRHALQQEQLAVAAGDIRREKAMIL